MADPQSRSEMRNIPPSLEKEACHAQARLRVGADFVTDATGPELRLFPDDLRAALRVLHVRRGIQALRGGVDHEAKRPRAGANPSGCYGVLRGVTALSDGTPSGCYEVLRL
eukprot:6651890-Pyramimonas_sp.AAC.1